MANGIERGFEKGLFASRWLLAPMYAGLVLALGLLVIVFARELLYYLPKAMEMTADKAILVVLTLIDLTLAANLMVIVIFSGYESFVSKLDVDVGEDRPGWMGKVDFGGLKMKLIASIIAISAIYLLKRFMEIGKTDGVSSTEMLWLVVFHGTFVISGVLMALMDWLGAQARKG
ncbi:TIGR00645 family protein [Aliiroseovarius sp.]|uniref:TIGR00645 family protein n=1 Tax=Aliiroseovarius sp. TaxID=1872442 RepID=UPI0026021C81|nr:TIGR00645 family protein [Aliiroseovarius sp.]